VDEFISSGEQKWGQHSGVVLLLPHGYEGQGPDHSSARMERFLTLCAQDNMTVAAPTTPANYFHLLRWQALSRRHTPLVIFTPKSMLRLKTATSAMADFTQGWFQPVIGDAHADPAAVRRVVFCTGKVYYDLHEARKAGGHSDTAIARVERLYPLPTAELRDELARYPGAADIVWAQEEPANMGAWPCMREPLSELAGHPVRLAALQPSSAPAAGSSTAHAAGHHQVIEDALN
jgi:2-oxoglutarate decarboxylase